MPYQAFAKLALARWRAARSAMTAAVPDSPAWQDAQVQLELAETAYREAIEDARRDHQPEPPPFEEVTTRQ